MKLLGKYLCNLSHLPLIFNCFCTSFPIVGQCPAFHMRSSTLITTQPYLVAKEASALKVLRGSLKSLTSKTLFLKILSTSVLVAASVKFASRTCSYPPAYPHIPETSLYKAFQPFHIYSSLSYSSGSSSLNWSICSLSKYLDLTLSLVAFSYKT